MFPENESMIFGTFQGTVYEVNCANKLLKTIYLTGKGLKTITHIALIPKSKLFIAFLTDKSFFILNRDLKDVNEDLISGILSFNSTTPSAKKKKKTNVVLSEYKSEISSMMEYEYYHNKEKSSNPVLYGKLKGGLITFISVINYESKDFIGITDRDGYLKLFELPNFVPYKIFKSVYGGFNSFTYEPSTNLLAIAGEDDAITLINLLDGRRLRILGHKSFVTSSFFFKGSKNKLYLLAGSLDGCVSLTKIHSVKWDNPENVVDYKSMLNSDGVGMLGMIANKFFFSCYDGVIGIYDTEILSKRGSRKVNRSLQERNIVKEKEEELATKLDKLKTESSKEEKKTSTEKETTHK